MWLNFKRDTPEDIERKARVDAAIRALEEGRILPRAEERIKHHMANGAKVFSTDMTAKEHILIEECGIQPLGQVMGTSFFKIGIVMRTARYTGEVHAIAEAYRMAREQAVYRMKKEAELYGADGIVSVRIKSSKPDYMADLIEFTAIGTAVKVHGWEPEDLENAPFTSEMSGQEFWQLIHAGYRPVNIVFGICAYYIHSDPSTRWVMNRSAIWNAGNQEVEQFTQGFYNARHAAIRGVQEDILQHGAEGCVGMSVNCDMEDIEYEINDTRYTDLLINVTAIGSSVKKMKRAHKPIERKPLTVLNLASKSFKTLGSRTDELRGSIEDNDFMGEYD